MTSRDDFLNALEALIFQTCPLKMENYPLARFDDQGVPAYQEALRILALERPKRWDRTFFGATLDRSYAVQ